MSPSQGCRGMACGILLHGQLPGLRGDGGELFERRARSRDVLRDVFLILPYFAHGD